MAADNYHSLVQAIYVSYFGRPADTFGLAGFAAQLEGLRAPTTARGLTDAYRGNASIRSLIDSFGSSTESLALYGAGTSETVGFVSSVYTNLLNRSPDAEGWNFWVTEINAGRLTRANASLAIMAGATDNQSDQGRVDAQVVANKVQIAAAFTNSIQTGPQFASYSGDAAAATARAMLAEVTAATDVQSFQPTIAATLQKLVSELAPTTTTNLTVGTDIFAGTSANDTFNVISVDKATNLDATTLGESDVINGDAGKDTLNIFSKPGINIKQDGRIKGVEIINIYNEGTTAATQFGDTAGLNAVKFEGATSIFQIGAAANKVIGLDSTTVAGFRYTAGQPLSVNAIGATASIVLDKVSGAASGVTKNVVALNVGGDLLRDVSVSGSVSSVDPSVLVAASIGLNVAVGRNVPALSIKTFFDTKVTLVEDPSSDQKLTRVDASASTGNVSIDASAMGAITDIATGSGSDVVKMGAALHETAKLAVVSTGSGNDVLSISATALPEIGATLTADAGAGADKLDIAVNGAIAYDINAGSGDDYVFIKSGALQITDIVKGGDGNDTIAFSGKARFTDLDYRTIALMSDFENLQFAGGGAAAGTSEAFDAGRVTNIKSIIFGAGGAVTRVGADQLLTTSGSLAATAAGYIGSAADLPASAALQITANGSGKITANAAVVSLTAAARSDTADGSTAVVLGGDFKSANVTLKSAANANNSAASASVSVDTTPGSPDAVANVTTLTFAGSGIAKVTNGASAKLGQVDASALASVTPGASAATGLVYSSKATIAETIKLGNGTDTISLGASTHDATDTVHNLSLVLNAGRTGLTAMSDRINIEGVQNAKQLVTAQGTLALALKEAGDSTVGDSLVFSFGGDTYVYQDRGSAGIDGGDIVVRIVGSLQLDALIVALATPIV
jgi:hypothetical protein